MKIKKYIFSIMLLMLLMLFLVSVSGCRKKTESAESGTKKICASFYPVYIMLLNITEGIENTELSLLAPANTGCLHDYQLTSRDMKNISGCDILVCCGAGMEDFIEKALEIKKESVIIASEGFELIDDNPHIWVSFSGAAYMTEQIGSRLAEMDPENGELYIKNAAEYIEKLETLGKGMHSRLDVYARYPLISFHEAFPYFAEEFNLKIADVIERESGTVPGAKELSAIIAGIKEQQKKGINPALFAEPQYSSSSAAVIARETGLKVYELDPCVTGNLEKNAYIDAMKKNTEVLELAFGGK